MKYWLIYNILVIIDVVRPKSQKMSIGSYLKHNEFVQKMDSQWNVNYIFVHCYIILHRFFVENVSVSMQRLHVKVQFTFFVFLVTIVHEKSILALKSTHIFPPTVSLTFKLAHESYIYIFKVQVLHSNRNLETTR